MRLLTGTMIGQSRGELAAAVSFSLVIHVIVISGALFLSLYVRTRVYIPPSYQVKLVDLPADVPLASPSMSAPPAAAPPPKHRQPAPPRAARAKPAPVPQPAPRPAAAPKHAMPELAAEKPKKEPAAAEPQAPSAASAKKQEAVAVTTGSQEFQFPPYVAIVRDKVERNWNPPPGARGAKVKVVFRVLRSGRVGEARLAESSGNFYFDQAAMRAILASSPFPVLPDGFFKDSEVFSVDLMEKE
jgi:TonB family protein